MLPMWPTTMGRYGATCVRFGKAVQTDLHGKGPVDREMHSKVRAEERGFFSCLRACFVRIPGRRPLVPQVAQTRLQTTLVMVMVMKP